MKVRATQTGFIYGIQRFPGSVIELRDEKHFSKHWMEKVDDSEVIVVTAPAPKSYHNALHDTPLAAINKPPMAITELERLAAAGSQPHPQVVAQEQAEDADAQPTIGAETEEGNRPPSGDRKVL